MDILESLEENCDYCSCQLHVPFMTKNWKKAIRDKRKAAKTYANNSTEENGK
ncbi:hypothetical protein pdam_00004694, partial [Pocillopora damicornis]